MKRAPLIELVYWSVSICKAKNVVGRQRTFSQSIFVGLRRNHAVDDFSVGQCY